MNTQKILDILKKHNTAATFFVLGWIAEHHPDVVHAILESNSKHEIATHGHFHELVYEQTPKHFMKQLKKSIKLLENLVDNAHPIIGHRAPSFSIKKNTRWAFDIMADCGIKYDSSIFPSARGQGGITSGKMKRTNIFIITTKSKKNKIIIEFPMSVIKKFGKTIPICGGGYFRILPYSIIREGIRKFNNKLNQPVIFYFHPRDIDPNQPKLSIGIIRRFKTYQGLKTAETKLLNLLTDFKWKTVSNIIRLTYKEFI
jgi:polysaccharide deacetylase family protein (PEP-CTERM system associated)